LSAQSSRSQSSVERHFAHAITITSRNMKRILSSVFALLLVCSPHVVKAIDESESLNWLVQTLDASDDPAIQTALMRGMLSGLAGRRNVAAPKGWSELSQKFASSDNSSTRELSTQLSQIFGDVKATQRALTMLQDPTAELNARRTALRSLLTQQNEEASSLLESLLD
jgi:hypothetical protein